MRFSKEYMEDLIVRMSHHSNAIENNIITLPETVSIILHNTVPNNVSLRELYEVDNHRYAMEYLLSHDTLEEEFSFDILFETHAILMDKLNHERGMFKSEVNYIKGADFDTVAPRDTYMMMKQWLDNVNYRIEASETDRDIIDAVCESHIEFERIHPFADGNGRTGRLVMNFLLVKNDVAPLVIEKGDKERYIFFLANQDVGSFSNYAQEKIKREFSRMKSFEPSIKPNTDELEM